MRQSSKCLIAFVIAEGGCSPKTEPSKGTNNQGGPDAAETAVRAVIAEHLAVDASAIPMDRPISAPPLGADELDLVEIVMELEERLGIAISDDAIERYAGGMLGKDPFRITPNQLASIVRESPKAAPPKRKK